MKVRELVALLLDVDEGMEVVTPGHDHLYNKIYTASAVQAELHTGGLSHSEYWGDDGMFEGSTVVDVFVVS